jgi:hypothetical protein
VRRITLLILILLPIVSFSQKDIYTIVTIYDGPGLRPASLFNSTEESIEILTSKGLEETDRGVSLNYELLGKSNYSTGIKFYSTIFSGFPILYAGLQPCIFRTDEVNGWNLRPELGFVYDPVWQYIVGLRFKLDYGYDIPLSNSKGFSYSRSIIEFKVGITFNVHHRTIY